MAKVARVGDSAQGVCLAHKDPTNWTGVIATGSSVLSVEGQACARIGDTGSTSCGHTFQIVEGSSVFTSDGIPVARQGDAVIVIQGGNGIITGGASTTDTV